jgi:hypothetical protein
VPARRRSAGDAETLLLDYANTVLPIAASSKMLIQSHS